MYGLLFIGYHLLVFGVLLLVGIRGSGYLSREIKSPGRRRGAITLLWLGVLAIPFWDYIPGKIYFNQVCKDAGVEVLDSTYSSVEGLKVRSIRTELPLAIERVEEQYSDPETGTQVARMRWYTKGASLSYWFYKPWLNDQCPRSAGPGLELASGVLGLELSRKMEEVAQ